MGAESSTATVAISVADLEALVRRVVHEAIREEFSRVLRRPDRAILDYWDHEGPADPEGDAELLAEALDIVREYEADPTGWVTLEELETEIAAYEASGELQS
jgi:hypothetical protein